MRQIREGRVPVRPRQPGQARPAPQAVPTSSRSDLLSGLFLLLDLVFFFIFLFIFLAELLYERYGSASKSFWMTSLDSSSRALKQLAGHSLPSERTLSLLHTTLTCAALGWLFYRAWLVLRIPLPQLVDLLGLEVPPAPDVSLAGIDVNSITLHWTRSESGTPIVKYVIQVNGIVVGESSRSETAITISGLNPDHYYGVRVVAVNANYQTTSDVIRVKTLSKDGGPESSTATGAVVRSGSRHGKGAGSGGEHRGEGLGARAQCHVTELSASSTGASVIVRDRQPGSNAIKRSATGRRSSPLTGAPETTLSGATPSAAAEIPISPSIAASSVEQLTARLDVIRREMEETQTLKAKEEEEFQETKASMVRERDRLKQLLKEKDEASAELRKEVQSLERHNRVVQSNKSAKERLLRQKQDERQKMAQDVERWTRETEGYRQEMEKMRARKQRMFETANQEMASVRESIHEWQTAIKEMEDDIRLKGAQIKEFEDQRRRLRVEEDDQEAQERERRAQEEDARWERKLRELQTTYNKMLHSVRQAQENRQRAQERLAWWRARGVTSPAQFAPSASAELEMLPLHTAPPRRVRSTTSRPLHPSSPVNGFPGEHPPMPSSTMASFFHPPSASAGSRAGDYPGLSREDVEQLTAGARMSPRADALLPSNLLSSDEDFPSPRIGSISAHLAATRASDGHSFSGLGAPLRDGFLHDAHSPDSAGSRAASLISSPHGSLLHLPGSHLGTDSPLGDNLSHHSLDAIPPDHPSSSSRRFANLFGRNLHRPRGKTMDAEPPALGDLTSNQTQSFPKTWDPPSGRLDPIGTKRRRGSYSTSWIGSMASFNSRNRSGGLPPPTSEEAEEPLPTGPSPRRKPFHMFGSGTKPGRPNLPSLLRESTPERPLSRSSGDHLLPRPSSDSQPFGWPVSRESPSGVHWSATTMDPWSRGGSRQSSGQYGSGAFGSTSSLSLGRTPLAGEPVDPPSSPPLAPQAPIGTRPRSSPRTDPSPLNPAAPSFKTLFQSRKEARRSEKAERQERAAELERERDKERERDRDFESLPDEVGHRRSSRDTRSLHTEESMAESTESQDRPASTTASDAGTAPSGTAGGGGGGVAKDRESIFQKISRKSSATKFNVPWKDKGTRATARRAAEPTTTTTRSGSPGDGDEDGSTEASLGRSVDSMTGSPRLGSSAGKGSLSWSSLRRKSKKGGEKPVGEAAERAGGSDRGDDDDAVTPLI